MTDPIPYSWEMHQRMRASAPDGMSPIVVLWPDEKSYALVYQDLSGPRLHMLVGVQLELFADDVSNDSSSVGS